MTSTPAERTTQALIRPRAVADRLGLSVRTIYDLIERGDLPAVRVTDKSVRIDPADLANFIGERRTGPSHKGEAQRK